jgi:hypothetical protein
MLRLVAVITVLLVCVLTVPVEAATPPTIHLITVADTNDAAIGAGARANAQRMAGYLQVVGVTLGVTIDSNTKVVDNDFSDAANDNCAKVRQALTAFTTGPDDVVVFYYSGHGFNKGLPSDPYPSFWCSSIGNHDVGLKSVATDISRKNPRLTIAIADACDSQLGQTPPSAAGAGAAPVDRLPLLKLLFLGYRGTLILASSSPKEFSWYLPTGGFFSDQLMRALDSATTPGHMNGWDDVIAGATKEIRILNVGGAVMARQHPQANKMRLVRLTGGTGATTDGH